jgi:thioredoxin reductase (NADPH)
MSQYLIDQIASKANIKVLAHARVISAEGEDCLERIEVCVDAPIEMESVGFYEADALFVMIGADASTSGYRRGQPANSSGNGCNL